MKYEYKPIQVDPYSPLWPKWFELEAQEIKNALGNNCLEIHHIGSTSIPGLSAKPTIDIIAVIKNRENVIEPLTSIGYQYKGEYNIPLRLFFNKKEPRDINLHVYEAGHPEIELNLCFRDYLRNHPKQLKAYENLKRQLLTKASSHEKKNSSFTGYNLGKNEFIRGILEDAGFNRLRMILCIHYAEWEAAKKFREYYFEQNQNKHKNENENSNFELEKNKNLELEQCVDPNESHLILYKGTKIIGYANVIWQENHSAKIPIVMFDNLYENQGYEEAFKELIETWVKQKQS